MVVSTVAEEFLIVIIALHVSLRTITQNYYSKLSLKATQTDKLRDYFLTEDNFARQRFLKIVILSALYTTHTT